MEENEKNIPSAPVSGVENDVTKAAPTTETPAAAPAQAAAPAAQPATPAGESAEKPAAAAPAPKAEAPRPASRGTQTCSPTCCQRD